MRTLVVAALVVAAAGDLAHADSEMVRARDLDAAGDFAGALAIVDQSLAAGDKDPDRLVELHLLGGSLAAKLDQPDIAVGHFVHVLALRPGRRLPTGTNDKVLAAFEAAVAKNVPALHLTASHVGNAVDVVLDGDPLHLVAGIRVRTQDAIGQPNEVVSKDLKHVEIPAGEHPVEVDALDEHGNRLYAGNATEPPPKVVKLAWWDHWKPYAAATAAFAITGSIFTSRAGDEQQRWNDLRSDDGGHDFSELRSIQKAGERDALVANILWGAAGAFAVVTVVQLVRHSNDPHTEEAPVEKKRTKRRLTAGPGPGSAGVSLGLTF